MSEVATRAAKVVGQTAGGTVSAAATALMGGAAVALGQPQLAAWAVPLAALAGSLTEEMVAYVHQLWQGPGERVTRFAETAAEEAGVPIEELMKQAAECPPLGALLNKTVAASATAHDDWKVDVLARAFVHAATDDTAIDEMLLLVEIIRQLEVPHARLLAASAEWNADLDPSQPRWLSVNRPQVHKALPILLKTTHQLGLTSDHVTYTWIVTELGKYCTGWLERLGKSKLPVEVAPD